MQEEVSNPLCCCEYIDRHSQRSHLLGFCCNCDEVDGLCDALVRGEAVHRDRVDSVLADIDDRMRVPTLHGAMHVGLPAVVPWILLPILTLVAAVSARGLALAACAVLPTLAWWHRRMLRVRRRSPFLFAWTLASIVWVNGVALLHTDVLRSHPASSATLAILLLCSLSLMLRFRQTCADSTHGISDADAALRRAARCPVCKVLVPRYDHYCGWLDRPVGASNHRAYLAFVGTFTLCCCFGGNLLGRVALEQSAPARSVTDILRANRSSLAIALSAYVLSASAAIGSLLLHQLLLLKRGCTAYELHRAHRISRPGHDSSLSRLSGLASFLNETAPILHHHADQSLGGTVVKDVEAVRACDATLTQNDDDTAEQQQRARDE